MDTIIRSPAEFNNTKLIDFITNNNYNTTTGLEEYLLRSDLIQCCNFDWGEAGTICARIGKPPGFFESIISERQQNSCREDRQSHNESVKRK